MAFNIEDFKEQVGNSLRNGWEQFQESGLYNQSKDRFENLSPTGQKAILASALIATSLILLSIPYSFFSTSSDSIAQFETKRNIIRDLLKVSREAHDTPDIPIPPPLESVKSQIEGYFRSAQLMPEQIKGVEMHAGTSELIQASMSAGFLKVNLAKLNLRQIIDLGYQIQSINPSLKVKDLAIEANTQNPKYFDVTFDLVALNVPQEPIAPPEPPEPAKRDRKKTNTEKSEE